MPASDLAWSSRRHGQGAVRCVVVPGPGPGPRQRPGPYAPHIVIVIVLVLALIGAPGQIEAALFALAAVLPLLGYRTEPA